MHPKPFTVNRIRCFAVLEFRDNSPARATRAGRAARCADRPCEPSQRLTASRCGYSVLVNTRDDDDKSEYDVDEDENVAGSRAGKDDEDDGTYVGRTASDDSLDTEETGAEARSNHSAR